MTNPTRPRSNGGHEPANCSVASCPLVGYEIVELIEVVRQDNEKLVVGSIIDPWHTKYPSENRLMRPFNENLRQYINVDQDLDGSGNRVPEYGRKICFRARVVQKNGQTDKLSRAKVTFSYMRTDGPNRSNPVGGQNVWKNKTVQGRRKEGFNRRNGRETISVRTDEEGWTTDLVVFYTSEYGGDQFKINAKLHRRTEGSAGGKTLSTENYQVWRKFWYQMTYADGHQAVKPEKAEAAYAEVFAEMVLSNIKKFNKSDFPDDLQDRTFLPEYMLRANTSDRTVVNVGEVNVAEFHRNRRLNLETDNSKDPIKESLIIAEYYCGPTEQRAGPQTIEIKSPDQLLSVELLQGAGGEIISKPAVNIRRRLVTYGVWRTKKQPKLRGRITDDNITINPNRENTLIIDVTLPSNAPIPTEENPIFLTLSLQTADEYLGLTPANGIVAVFDPISGDDDKNEDCFNDTVAHEFGHKWDQTPTRRDVRNLKMRPHPLQYEGHGGWGSHCRSAAEIEFAGNVRRPRRVNWQNGSQDNPSLRGGDCIMFDSSSSNCTHKFCDVCKPYLQLQDMSSLDEG